MAPATSIKLNYDDYLLMPSDGRRYEIIDGELYVNPAPATRHQAISVRLLFALHGFVVSRDLGYVFHAPIDVRLGEHDIVEPDIVYVSATRAHIITDKNIVGAPDLVIEILSHSNREYDTRVKFHRYEQHGVREYWIIDPENNVASIYRRSGARFEAVEVADALTTPLLPGLSIPLSDIFA